MRSYILESVCAFTSQTCNKPDITLSYPYPAVLQCHDDCYNIDLKSIEVVYTPLEV